MQTSSPARPCPCCGRTRDSDCRWNDNTILCHQGQSHGPPSHLKRGDTINIGGKQWGTCVAVVANPASDLLELDTGALVPSVFVVESTAETIVIDPPDGLFELKGSEGGQS